ncbi:hypothetical protein EPN18_10140 [bacterium]|nr:MAG: hypothetical protein EPN18_10140 [bacterium]
MKRYTWLFIAVVVVAAVFMAVFEPGSLPFAVAFVPVMGLALTEDRDTSMREGVFHSFGAGANSKIFAGSIGAVNAAGYAVPASDTAGLRVVGRVDSRVDNTGGADGALTVVMREGVFKFAGSGLTSADVGKQCYVVDDQTISVSSTVNNVFAGTIIAVDGATEAWVEMDLSDNAVMAKLHTAAVAGF